MCIIAGLADVAQLVEQLIRNEKVEGSTPFIGTRIYAALQWFAKPLYFLRLYTARYPFFRKLSALAQGKPQQQRRPALKKQVDCQYQPQ